jgi:hypothetical protein
MTNSESKLAEAIILACLERNPIDFRRVDVGEVKRARRAIKRAVATDGAKLRYSITRKHFLCGCLDFTDGLLEEHLIVGYGYRYGNTTEVERIHHVTGEERRVAIPEYLHAEIRRHHFHRSDAEVIVFHNHPRTGDEPQWFYTLKALLQDLPIASNADRQQLQHHAFNSVGLLRQFFGQGQVMFYLGESGFVKQFLVPPLLPFLDQLNRASLSKTANA